MIIGIDASRANNPIKTGVEWYSYHLIQEFKKIDRQNQYFLYTNKKLEPALVLGPENFHEKLLKWLPVRMWTLIRLSWEMKFGKNKPDLLFIPAHTIPLWNPSKVVVTVHDIGFERFPELYQWADKFYHRWTIKFIKKHATKIITISEFSKKEISDFYKIPAEKIEVVHCGYDHNVYRRLDNETDWLSVKDQLKLNAPFFMFLGRLEAKKNTANLVKAFGEFKKAHPDDPHKLLLVGRRGFGFEEVEEAIYQYKLNDAVLELPWQESEVNAQLLNHADLFIFPSLYEGFGIPVLEAMACGCPVICSNTTSLPEVACEAAIKFNPLKIEAMVKAIETVAFNPEVKTALVERGFEQIKSFSWEKTAVKLKEIFEKV
jgi:glycosyltransferase involved in cell wall biosynthesis